MKRLLLTWSDRGSAGPVPKYHGKRDHSDRGPIQRLLDQAEFAHRYDAAIVLTTPQGEALAQELADELRQTIHHVTVRVTQVDDPSDYYQLFLEHERFMDEIHTHYRESDWDRDVLLSAGTPQSQTMWVILVQAALLNARMLQVIPAAFVPYPHPHAVREVQLNFEGFPEIRALREEVRRLRATVRLHAGEIVGESKAMRQLLGNIVRVAASDVPVLVLGATGTGKELVARAVHSGSARAEGPFVAENCGAFSEGLLSSELFGHEQGAFSGAVNRHRGLFEQAHGGTLFLDEIGELGMREQVHLLRVLQEGTFRRVGGEQTVRVDVRIIAATHRAIETLVEQGTFRQDLYYRLRGATLNVPSLKERPEDIPLLVHYFLQDAAPQHSLKVHPEAMQALMQYSWPGNVRELRSEVVRWTVFVEGTVTRNDLAPEMTAGISAQPTIGTAAHTNPNIIRPLAQVVGMVEKSAILAALSQLNGNLSQTASSLHIDRNTLKRKLSSYGMR